MAKMWAGRTDGKTSKIADDFNSSISFDSRMFKEDIEGSMAHAAMLGATGIIKQDEAEQIIDALGGILEDIKSGKLSFSDDSEDIHMFIEEVLTERIGDVTVIEHLPNPVKSFIIATFFCFSFNTFWSFISFIFHMTLLIYVFPIQVFPPYSPK